MIEVAIHYGSKPYLVEIVPPNSKSEYPSLKLTGYQAERSAALDSLIQLDMCKLSFVGATEHIECTGSVVSAQVQRDSTNYTLWLRCVDIQYSYGTAAMRSYKIDSLSDA